MRFRKGAGNNGVEILIVEDSPTQAEHLKSLLEERGFTVAVAANGREALAAARGRRPALIISDIVMPEMDGYTLCKEIKAHDTLKETPVVLVTLERGVAAFQRPAHLGDSAHFDDVQVALDKVEAQLVAGLDPKPLPDFTRHNHLVLRRYLGGGP